jgi:acetate kinase
VAGIILTLNAGSSSLKFALYSVSEGAADRNCEGKIDGIGSAPRFAAHDASGSVLAEQDWPADAGYEALLKSLLDWIDHQIGTDELVACGHRVVHGGRRFIAPVRITPEILAELDQLVPLAPLHQIHNLAAMRAVEAARPNLPHVACFDTAFHHDLAPVVRRVALPVRWEDDGIRRYGFHGLSYEYIAGELGTIAPQLAAGRTIVAHLGNGASLCALDGGRSVDTTMGFTPLDGLVMGTRCGAIDPGIILYLQRHHAMTAAQIEDLLYYRSGLLGVSGISNDVRTLLASDDPAARDALELFVFHIARQTGALTATLGGLDGFVFTAGIGENAPAIRTAVCNRLRWQGVVLDEAANLYGRGRISASGSAVEVWVIPTDEEGMIVRHTTATLGLDGRHRQALDH